NLAAGQKGMMFGALLKFIAPAITVFPGVIAVVALPALGNSAEAYPQLVAQVMPPYLIGFIAAIMFGASLTTFNSGLNSTSTLAVLNLYKPIAERRGRDVPERQLIRLGKGMQVVLALIAMTIAPFIALASDGFYEYFQRVAGFFSIPIFTIVFVGLITKRVPSVGAKVALVFYLVCYGYTQLVNDFGLHFLHIAAILFALSASIMFAFGRYRPQAQPFTRPDTSAVDLTPWQHRVPVYVLSIVAMLAVIFWLSPFGVAAW
ncbi:MAG: solute:sodium symporter family transporter, partial [Pseudomonadota bacterium]